MSYGGYYRGGGGGEVDPIAAAIQGALGTGMTVYQMRQESNERKRRAQQEADDRATDQAWREDDRDYRRGRDTVGDQERAQERTDRQAREMRDAGVMATPGGPTPFMMGPTKREREMTETAGVQEKLQRPDLEAEARSLGVDSSLASPDLRAAIQAAMSSRSAAAEGAKNDREFKESVRLKQTPSYSDLHPTPKDSDTPTFLRDDAESKLAATLTQPWFQNGIQVAPGMDPQSAATESRSRVAGQRQAAFEAERQGLQDLYRRAFENEQTPEGKDRATKALMAAQQQLSDKYKLGRP